MHIVKKPTHDRVSCSPELISVRVHMARQALHAQQANDAALRQLLAGEQAGAGRSGPE